MGMPLSSFSASSTGTSLLLFSLTSWCWGSRAQSIIPALCTGSQAKPLKGLWFWIPPLCLCSQPRPVSKTPDPPAQPPASFLGQHLTPHTSETEFLFPSPKNYSIPSFLYPSEDTCILPLVQGKSLSGALSSSLAPPPVCQKILLGLPSKYAKNPSISPHLHCPPTWSRPSWCPAWMTSKTF